MKKAIITVGAGVISGLVGFVIGSKWTEKKLKTKLEDIYQAEFDAFKKSYAERHSTEDETKPTEEAVDLVAQTQAQIKNAIMADNKKKRDYMKKANPDSDDYGGLEEDDIVTTEKGPYIISYEEYTDDNDYMSKTLTWDPIHAALNDDEEEELIPSEDIDATVSFEALDLLENGGESVVYVRNDEAQTDYVISLANEE